MRGHLRRSLDVIRRAPSTAVRLARRLGSALADLHYQQRRLLVLRQSQDSRLAHPDAAPDTYLEFLARTSGPLLHEPSARARLAGRQVR